MLPAVETTQQGDVGLIYNIKELYEGKLSGTACPE